MARKPVEFWGLMSAGAASIAGILGAGLIVMEVIYRLAWADWDDFSLGGLFKPLLPAAILLTASLALVSIQPFLDDLKDKRNDPFK